MNRKIVAIGGIGGSGTRVVAEVLKDFGYFIGEDLNQANDNLLFTLIFKRLSILTEDKKSFYKAVDIFFKIMSSDISLDTYEKNYLKNLVYDRELHSKQWLKERFESIKQGQNRAKWAWKEPNTHVIIDKFLDKFKNLKFIYVYRNGLDMAYSDNQNQLILWGRVFLDINDIHITPNYSLRYWIKVQERILRLKEIYPENIMLLNFDDMTLQPEIWLKKISIFLQEDFILLKNVNEKIKQPKSIGRHKIRYKRDFISYEIDLYRKIIDKTKLYE